MSKLSLTDRFSSYSKNERIIIKTLKSIMEESKGELVPLHAAIDVYEWNDVCQDMKRDTAIAYLNETN